MHNSSKEETYFGLKLHAVVTTEGYVTYFSVTEANIDDSDVLLELTSSYRNIQIIGDKDYVSDDLAKAIASLLLALNCKNTKIPYPKGLRNYLSKS